MKNLFQGIASIVLSKKMFLLTSEMVSPNKQNAMTFHTEIGLKVIFKVNCFTCKGIVQYLRHKTKQYCHTNIFIGFI